MLLLDLQHGSGPLYRRIYHELKGAIQSGRLAPGMRLPSSRALAADHGISRNTVNLAYEQLVAQGYITCKTRASPRVAAVVSRLTKTSKPSGQNSAGLRLSSSAMRVLTDPTVPSAARQRASPRYDFRYGNPAVRDFPREAWRRLLATHARCAAPDAFGYGDPAGHAPLRAALSDYLKRARGLVCEPDQILITNGAQQGFDLAARVLLNPGDMVVVEEPRYPGSTLPLQAAGGRLSCVEVDAHGLDTSRLSQKANVRLACVSPCHQFPTGAVMSLERRLALLKWAEHVNAWVVEDDYISEFRYEGHPLEALQSLNQERVIHVGTFSKTLFPALRLGYMVVPPSLVQAFLAMKFVTDRFTESLAQQALATFITSGQFERHVRRTSVRNAGKRQILVDALQHQFGDRIEIVGRAAGVHLLVWLNDIAPAQLGALIQQAASVNVGLYSITPYYARAPQRAGLLMGYAALTEAEIRTGVRRLSTVY